ncbi:MAG: sulfatase family protein, partial [Planctomycetia bacterium]
KVYLSKFDWDKGLLERPMDKPFFLWMGFIDPHRPYDPNSFDPPHDPKSAAVPPYLPDDPAVRRDLAMYYDEIARMDAEIGRTLKLLEDQGAAKNTVVIFLSDNGRPFHRAKTTLYDSGIQTPLIVRWPGVVKPGSTTNALLSSIDLAPTLLELAGAPSAATFQGKSFAELLRSTDPAATAGRDAVFAEHNWHDFEDRQRAVRTARWKYIRSDYADLPLTPPADALRSPTGDAFRARRAADTLTTAQKTIYETPRPTEELYDAAADPDELRNLAGEQAYKVELDAMRGRLDDWLKATGDAPPAVRRPDEFDRTTGEPLKGRLR